MPFVKPTRYVIEYTDRQLWEKLHRAPNTEQADPVDFRVFLDVKTLKTARKEVVRLLEKWPFAQPTIHRRTDVRAVSWDYCMVQVSDDDE
jgi:hypothetical protein